MKLGFSMNPEVGLGWFLLRNFLCESLVASVC